MTDKKHKPAFPHQKQDGSPYWGMTLRDWFATAVDKDEYGDLLYKNSTFELMESLAGKKPEEPNQSATIEERLKFRTETLDWNMRFRAAIRYRMADAMIAARDK